MLKCSNCEKVLTKSQFDRVISNWRTGRRANKTVFCSVPCYHGFTTKLIYDTCPECEERKLSTSKRCGGCARLGMHSILLDSEILHLVTINPGIGFKIFADNIWGTGSSWNARNNLREFLEAIGKFESVDYFAHLNDPSRMELVYQDKLPKKYESLRCTRGQRRSGPSSFHRNRRKRLGLPMRHGTTKIKVPPKFNWGEIKPPK